MRHVPLVFFLFLKISVTAQVAVSLDGVRTVYAGVTNPITVVVSDVPTERVWVRPSQGEVVRREGCFFDWNIGQRDSTTAWLELLDWVTLEPFDTLFFRVKMIPQPQFRWWTGHHGGGGLAAVLRPFDFDLRCDVLRYECSFFKKNQDPAPWVRNLGTRANAQISAWMAQATPGDAVCIRHIRYRCGCDPTVRVGDDQSWIIR
jgi:hypothetical protein